MRKFILPVTILLIIAFTASLFTGLWEKRLPEMERITTPDGRVSLLLPKGTEIFSTPESPVQETASDYCCTDFMELDQASEDFPETEIELCRETSSTGRVVERIRPDLIVFYGPEVPTYIFALLKHPDGGVVKISLLFLDKIQDDEDFCARMRDIIIPSIQPGPAVRDLSARTEKLDLPHAGINLEIPVPEGFFVRRDFREYEDLDDDRPPYLDGMSLQWMRPLTRAGNTFFVSISTKEGAPDSAQYFVEPTKQEGVLLGQKMEWTLDKQEGYRTKITGSVTYGSQGRHFVVEAVCPKEDLPTFFSLVEQIKGTITQP